ncbi:MAG: enolase C-terminal domain-like protein [Salinirussus sp.]
MSIAVEGTDIRLVNLETRFPFEFGIATMTRVPHCFVSLEVAIDGEQVNGLAADHFPPRWLTKDPDLPLTEEAKMILEVVKRACDHAADIDGRTVFDCWSQIHQAQREWAAETSYPPLLWNFGVTFIERALIDAYCRATGQTFGESVRQNSLGIRPGAIYPELEGAEIEAALPSAPERSIAVRHTVGHGDPLREAADEPDDDLPRTLAENIETYGLDRFKVKVAGEPAPDAERVREVLEVLEADCDGYGFTLDANEQYEAVDQLAAFLDRAESVPGFTENLLFIEQPFPRDVALTADIGRNLESIADRYQIVIDESDGELDSFGRALDLGYDGTSHKNCKGVIKGVVNAMLADRHRESGESVLLTGEDLTTIGPVSLQQDLAAMATLGIEHVERNGHHYFRGLEGFPSDVQESVLAAHGDLYRELPDGTAALQIENGQLDVESVLEAPFGYAGAVDIRQFSSPAQWSFEPS